MMDIVTHVLSIYSMSIATPEPPESVGASLGNEQQPGGDPPLSPQDAAVTHTSSPDHGDDDNLERRRGQRITVTTPIEVALLRSGEPAGTGKIRDVALHGMFIETEASFPKNAYLQLRFNLAGEDAEYHPWANVVHRTNGGLGLAMDVLQPQNQVSLEAVENFAKAHPTHE